MYRFVCLLLFGVFSLSTTSFSQTASGCKLKFTGKSSQAKDAFAQQQLSGVQGCDSQVGIVSILA